MPETEVNEILLAQLKLLSKISEDQKDNFDELVQLTSSMIQTARFLTGKESRY